MRQRLNVNSVRLLNLLCKATGPVQFYTIYNKVYFSTAELSTALVELSAAEFIKIDRQTAVVTSKGLVWAMAMATVERRQKSDQVKKIPVEFLAEKIVINQPYAPSISRFAFNKKIV